MRLRQEWDALVEVHVPTVNSREPVAFVQKLRRVGKGWYKPGRWSGTHQRRSGRGGRYQWHVRGDACRRTPAPNLRLMSGPCLPSSPRPEAMAGGMRTNAPAEWPGIRVALYLCERINWRARKRSGCPAHTDLPHRPTPMPLFHRKEFPQPLVVVGEGEHDDPGLIDRVPLKT